MVKIITLNVGRLFPFLNRFFPIRKSSIERVRAQLQELNADIVLLQEVAGKRHLEELVEGTEYYTILGPCYEHESSRENVALLCNREIRNVSCVPESNALSVSIPDYDINATNVHLHLRKRRRLKQIKHLLSKIKLRRAILGGDFNGDAREYESEKLRSCTSQIGSTTLYWRHIDDILYTPDIKVESTKVINKTFGLMDHYPIMAIIT